MPCSKVTINVKNLFNVNRRIFTQFNNDDWMMIDFRKHRMTTIKNQLDSGNWLLLILKKKRNH